jgi:membrane-associated phospholipid phosphatase
MHRLSIASPGLMLAARLAIFGCIGIFVVCEWIGGRPSRSHPSGHSIFGMAYFSVAVLGIAWTMGGSVVGYLKSRGRLRKDFKLLGVNFIR